MSFGIIINHMLNNQYILYVDVLLIFQDDNRRAKGLGQGISLYLANNNNRIYLPTGFCMNALDHNMLRARIQTSNQEIWSGVHMIACKLFK